MIIGEHELSRAFVRAWCRKVPGLEPLAVSGPTAMALRLVRRWRPDLVLMDLEGPDGVGLAVLRALQARHPSVKTLIYSGFAHDDTAIQAIRAGATGFVVKTASGSELEGAIRTVLAGGSYLSPPLLRLVGRFAGLNDSAGAALGAGQTELLRLLASGASAPAIAQRLKLSVQALASQKQALAKRLGLKRASELLGFALGAGLGPGPGGHA